jgi:hypothetical protein
MANLLEEKTDEMVAGAQAKQEATSIIQEEQAEQNYDLFADEPVVQDTALEPDPQVQEALIAGMDRGQAESGEPKGVQVASIFGKVGKAIGERVAKAEKTVIPGLADEPIQEIGGRFVIREMPEDEIENINAAMGGDYIKSLNLPAISEGMGDADMADWFAQFKTANAELIEDARRGTLNIEALVGLAEEIGADEITERILRRKPGQALNPEEMVGGVFAVRSAFMKTRELFEAAHAMPEGVEKQLAYSKWARMLTMTQRLAINVSGGGSEAARTTYAMGALQKTLDMPGIQEIADDFNRILGPEGPETLEHLGILYSALPTTRSKNKFMAEAGSALNRGMDVISEIWINSILSLPVTHAVNIAGNASFMSLRILETFAAAGVGKVRSAITGDTDYVRVSEGLAQLKGISDSWLDALLVAGKTLKTEEAAGATKIDVRRMQAIGSTGDLGEIAGMWREGNVSAALLNTVGSSMRLGGRFLLAEDAFFKGMGYRMALRTEAEIASSSTYDAAIRAGKSKEEASILAAQEKVSVLTKPNETIKRRAVQQSEIGTFQGDLNGFLGQVQGAMSHPLAKIIVPFFKTPTNVMGETLIRSPIQLANPDFYRTIAAGGRKADLAIARVGVGSAIMSTFAMLASGEHGEDGDMIIMGSGPPKPAERQALARKGIQPYSVNFANYDENGVFDGTYTSVTYSRLDPVSGILAMAADFAYYANYEDDQSNIEALAMAATVGMQEYMMQLPLLQGVEELATILTSSDRQLRGTQLQEFFARKLTETGLAVIPGTSSFSAGISRQIDPTVKSTMLPEEGFFGEDVTELGAFGRGFYTELQRMKARNPFFSDAVEPKLNLWGEEIRAGSGEAWEFWSPIRIQDTVYTPLDDEILRLGQGIRMPSKKQHNILLNASQYNRMIVLMNEADDYGLMPGDDGYRPGQTLKDILSELIQDEDYLSAEREVQHELFSAMVTAKRRAARDALFEEDDTLKYKLEQLQQQ